MTALLTPAAEAGAGVGDWIKWSGGNCPVDGRTRVDVEFRDGTIWTDRRASTLASGDTNEDYWTWEPSSPEDDIVAYRVAALRSAAESARAGEV